MYPYIHIHLFFFEKDFTSYGIMALIGFAFFIIPSLVYSKKNKEDYYNRFIFLSFILAAGAIGAMLLYTITNIPYWINTLPKLINDLNHWSSYIRLGLVYYGGFFGVFVGMMLYAKVFHEDVRIWLWQTIVSIPGFHAFGRIGCLLSGCCYGRIVDHGGVYNALIDKYCIPVQLYEAIGEIIIFIIILVRNIKIKDENEYYKPLGVYCILYSILRFILEFWRGDSIRGIWGLLSTSQYISIALLPFGIYCLICPTSQNLLNKMFAVNRRIKHKSTIENQ